VFTEAKPRPKYKLEVEVPEAIYKLLTAAAGRRKMSVINTRDPGAGKPMTVPGLALQIIGGVVTRGSVDRALAGWGEYTAAQARLSLSFKLAAT
jgi:hypothetical protein